MHIYVFVSEQWMLSISSRTKDKRALSRHTHVHSVHACSLTIMHTDNTDNICIIMDVF